MSISVYPRMLRRKRAMAAYDLGTLVDACDKITCQCWGNPNTSRSKEILAGFGATYHATAKEAFVLNPRADKDSRI